MFSQVALLAFAALGCSKVSEVGMDSSSTPDLVPYANNELEAYVRRTMVKWHAPGMAVAIVDSNRTWAKGFGYATLSSTPVTPETLFCGGSTVKSFTSAAISLLIDQAAIYSDIQWTTPISRLLKDDFVLTDDWATQHVTIEDALSHRTGYPRHDFAPSSTPRETVRNLRNLAMSAEPRSKWQYSNKMFAVIGYLISHLSGQKLCDFMRTRLWEPIGMCSTYLTLAEAKTSGNVLATSYFYNNDTQSYTPVPYIEVPGDEGAGMVVSNVLDYAKYLRLMINGGEPLSPSGRQAILGAHMLTSAGLTQDFVVGAEYYGLGWSGGVVLGEACFHHNGRFGEFTTAMWIFPRRKFGVVVMQNSASDAHDLVSRRIIYDFFNVADKERIDFERRSMNATILNQRAIDTCLEQLYPILPIPPLPLPTSLFKHAGRYFNTGYGNLTISLACNATTATGGMSSPAAPTLENNCFLRVEPRPTAAGPAGVELQHVSGDSWIGWGYVPSYTGYRRPLLCIPVKMKIDGAGRVTDMGMVLNDDVPSLGYVWFQRTD